MRAKVMIARTDEELEEIASRYESGWSYERLCAHFRCGQGTIMRALIANDVPLRGGKPHVPMKPLPTLDDRVVSLRRERYSYESIARKTGIDMNAVRKTCLAAGLKDWNAESVAYKAPHSPSSEASTITISGHYPGSDYVRSMREKFGDNRVVVVPPVETSRPINAPRLFIGDRYGSPRAVVLSP